MGIQILAKFIVQPSKFCTVTRFICTRGFQKSNRYAPMTPPWYKTNNPAEFADLIFETPWYK